MKVNEIISLNFLCGNRRNQKYALGTQHRDPSEYSLALTDAGLQAHPGVRLSWF